MSNATISWGIKGKTFWNWMELLIVPVMLASGAMYLDMSQTAKQNALETSRIAKQDALEISRIKEARRIEDERYKIGILNDYRRSISDLVTGSELLSAERGKGIAEAATALTRATLTQLDGAQKGDLLRFLFHSELIGHPYRERAVISLFNADFKDAQLIDSNLSSANLNDADLAGANLTGATLFGTLLNDTFLAKANLSGAVLLGTKGLTCEQLQEATNWESTYRDEILGCDRPIPEFQGQFIIEEQVTN